MKKIISALLIILLVFTIVGCNRNASSGGEVLDSSFKLVAEQVTPTSGTPDDYTAQENLAYAAYKFNRASSWEAVYTGEITAIGTKQRVKNTRQFSDGAMLVEAISVSGIKKVAEQRYYKNDNFLRRPYVKLDKNTMEATWSNNITKLSTEEYYRDYGLIPNEIFKYVMDSSTITSAQKIDSANYAYKFVLSTECVKYLKNEVRTLAGSKSDPEFLSVECTIEMDENWNIIRTTTKEKYKIAIMGGVTCNSTATEEFKVGQPVNIKDKGIFDAYIPNDDTNEEQTEQPKQPIDYLTDAFNNLANEDIIMLNAEIGEFDTVVNFDTNTGLLAIKLGDIIVKSAGDYIYVFGKENVKFNTLSLLDAIYMVMSNMPEQDVSPEISAPETQVLIGEVMNMLAGASDNESESESMINRILEGMDMEENDNVATITVEFTLDNVNFDFDIKIEGDTLSSISGNITFGESTLPLSVSPTDEVLEGNTQSAVDVSDFIGATLNTISDGYVSLVSGDNLVTLYLDGGIYFNSPSLNASYDNDTLRLDTLGKKVSVDLSEYELPELNEFDIMQMLAMITVMPQDIQYTLSDNELTVYTAIEQTPVTLNVKVVNDKLNFTLDINGTVYTSTNEVATMDEQAKYAKINSLINVASDIAKNGRLDLLLSLKSQKINGEAKVSIDFNQKYAIAQIGETIIQATDALYVIDPNFSGKISYEALTALTQFEIPELEIPEVNIENVSLENIFASMLAVIADAQIYSVIDTTIISYSHYSNDGELSISLITGEGFDLVGYFTYNGENYSFSICDSELLTPVDTTEYVTVDPIAYFVRDLVSHSTTYSIDVTTEDKELSAYAMIDVENMGVAVQLSDTYLYAYDKLYLQNLNSKYSLAYDTIENIISQLIPSDIIPSEQDITSLVGMLMSGTTDITAASISETSDQLIISVNDGTCDVEIVFSRSTNYLEFIKVVMDEAEIVITPSLDYDIPLPQSFEDFDSLDELVKATFATANGDYISLINGDNLVTVFFDGKVYYNSSLLKASYSNNTIRMDFMDKKVRLDLSEYELPELNELDIMQMLAMIATMPQDTQYTLKNNELNVSTVIEQLPISLNVKAANGKLNITLDIGGTIFTSTDEVATMDEQAEYAIINPVINLASKIAQSGRLDLLLSLDANVVSGDAKLSVDFNQKYAVAQIDETIIQATDALYVIDPNFSGKISYEALTALTEFEIPELEIPENLPEFEIPDLDTLLSYVLAIVADTQIYSVGGATVISYSYDFGGSILDISLSISEGFDLSGSLTYNGQTYTISISDSELLTPVDTSECVTVDPIAYFARDFVSRSTTYSIGVMAGDIELNAYAMIDIENMGLAFNISNTYLYAYDKLYMSNLNSKYSLEYNSIIDAIKQLIPSDSNLTEQDIANIFAILASGTTSTASASISETDTQLIIAVDDPNCDVEIVFSRHTNYLDHISIVMDGAEIVIAPSFDYDIPLPQSFEEYEPIENVASIFEPIKHMAAQKQFTLTLEQMSFDDFDMSGSVAIDVQSEPKVYIDLTFIQGETTHNLKAILEGENVGAIYNDTLSVSIDHQTILTLVFMVTDLLNIEIEELESFRPENSKKLQSDLIDSLIPSDIKEQISEITSSNSSMPTASFDVNKILNLIDTFALDMTDGTLSASLEGYTVSISYGETIQGITLTNGDINVAVSIDYTVEPIVLPETAFDLTSLPSLIEYTLKTAELSKFNVSGKIKLSLIGLINPTINFTLKTELVDGNPLVYFKLEIPHNALTASMLPKTESYIYFYDGVMYLKSDRYKNGFLNLSASYQKTVYLKRTPEEFMANAMEDIFFLIPVSDTIVNTIMGSIESSETKLDFTNAFTQYSYANDKFNIGVDLKAMLGNNNLGTANLTLTASEKLGDKAITDISATMKLLGSLISITLDASLNEYEGTISYGQGEGGQANTDLSQMPEVIESLKSNHAEWQN